MALAGWTKKCLVTVAAGKLTYTVSNQVVLFTAAHFNSEMLTLGGPNACRSDGADLRFSTDADATSLLAFDLLGISLEATPATSTLVVAIRFPTITAGASFTFYCHWGNSSADFPAKDSASGAGTCWSALYGCVPLKEDPAVFTTTNSKWKCFKESTGRYSSGNIVAAPTQVAGPIPGLKALSISAATGGVQIPEVVSTARGGFQVAMLVNVSAFTGFYFSQSQTATDGLAFDGGIAKIQYSGNWGFNFSSLTGTWGILRAAFDSVAGTLTVRFKTLVVPITWSGPFTNLQYIGSGTASLPMYCALFMTNIFTQVDDNFFKNIEDSITNNATLASAGAVSAISSANALTITGLKADSLVKIHRVSDGAELAGTPSSSTSFVYNFSYSADTPVKITVLHLEYDYLSIPLTLTNSSITVPVQYRQDRVYANPA